MPSLESQGNYWCRAPNQERLLAGIWTTVKRCGDQSSRVLVLMRIPIKISCSLQSQIEFIQLCCPLEMRLGAWNWRVLAILLEFLQSAFG